MKKAGFTAFVVAFLVVLGTVCPAQNTEDTTRVYKVVKQNGVAFIGKIISQDAREILVETEEVGRVYIPKHEVREIVEAVRNEKPLSGGLFSTRYFLTTNGFSIKKGENYVIWNLFGPEFQFGVADNLGLGIMTSWVGMPVIGTAKYSFRLSEKLFGGVGFLAGTGSWAYPEFGLLLPFGFLTFGNRLNNLNLSAGYGALFTEKTETVYTIQDIATEWSTNSYISETITRNDAEGRPLLSVAGMFRLNNKYSIVFDSFIMLPGKGRMTQSLITDYDQTMQIATYSIENTQKQSEAFIVISPGLRFQANEHSSFQFGFTGVHAEGEFIPAPIPMIQWFRKI